jgi:hypothetical protein
MNSNRPRALKLVQFRGGLLNGRSKYIHVDVAVVEVPVEGREQPARYVKAKLQDGIVEWWEPAP